MLSRFYGRSLMFMQGGGRYACWCENPSVGVLQMWLLEGKAGIVVAAGDWIPRGMVR